MKLIACFNVYNEAEYFEEALLSIKGKVDKIVVVDGAYKKFPHEFPYSTDRTIEIALKYADQFIGSGNKPWKSEIVKRNQYLIGKPGDLYLIIDGHEIWTGDFIPPFGNYRIKMRMADGWHETFRMFEHKPGICYKEFHYSIWIDGKPIGQDFPVYPHGHLTHLNTKDKIRLEAKKKYYSLQSFDN